MQTLDRQQFSALQLLTSVRFFTNMVAKFFDKNLIDPIFDLILSVEQVNNGRRHDDLGWFILEGRCTRRHCKLANPASDSAHLAKLAGGSLAKSILGHCLVVELAYMHEVKACEIGGQLGFFKHHELKLIGRHTANRIQQSASSTRHFFFHNLLAYMASVRSPSSSARKTAV